jgi:hypothetical protein
MNPYCPKCAKEDPPRETFKAPGGGYCREHVQEYSRYRYAIQKQIASREFPNMVRLYQSVEAASMEFRAPQVRGGVTEYGDRWWEAVEVVHPDWHVEWPGRPKD